MYYTKWQTGEPKSNDDSNDNTDSQTNDEDANGESTSNEESNAESNAESTADSNDDSSDNSDSNAESKARCIVTDSEFKWITVECATETKYYICSRPLVPNCGINGRCKINNAFLLPLHD